MFGPIGIWEMVIILVIALIVFGPRKLPELGRSLGKSLGEFKRASNELRNTLDEEIRIEERRTPKTAASKTGSAAAPATVEAGSGNATEAAEPSTTTTDAAESSTTTTDAAESSTTMTDAAETSTPPVAPKPATVATASPDPHPTEPGAGA